MNRSHDPIPSAVPSLRVQAGNDAPINADGDYVLYWMIANRRTSWNFSLDRAVDWARHLGKPLVVFEALRCGYEWASDRIHAFVVQGIADNARRLADRRVTYYPYLEPSEGDGQGLLGALAERACVVVTDEFPCFFLPCMVKAAGERLPVRLEQVDSNGLLPLRATDRIFLRAVDFRRYLQKNLGDHLGALPRERALAGAPLAVLPYLPAEILERWPTADPEAIAADLGRLAELPIDHTVPPVSDKGGARAAAELLERFLDARLGRYDKGRNNVVERVTSELSPYLHFGHISAHQVFVAVAEREDWDPGKLFHKATGSRRGWWGMSEAAEGYLDQIVTWRELGYNMSSKQSDYQSYESLPAWAINTLEEHRPDERPFVYSREEFEQAATHDELWNAAQNELRRDGRIHNYLRMLWGKKILHWSPTPREALKIMIHLNNKYALDGRNPNSYSGIFWCLGRYDRPWGPERPIFGKIRYMTSDSTRRKLDAKAYIAEFGSGAVPGGQGFLPL